MLHMNTGRRTRGCVAKLRSERHGLPGTCTCIELHARVAVKNKVRILADLAAMGWFFIKGPELCRA